MEGLTIGFLKNSIPQFITIDKSTVNKFNIKNVWIYEYSNPILPLTCDKTIAVFKVKLKENVYKSNR